MPEHGEHIAENILNNIMESFADNGSKQKPMKFFDEGTSVSTQLNKLFGRQKSIHKILGGGKSADMLLWRNKKLSTSGLIGSTAIWVLFEWLNYHFLTIVCFVLVIGMIIQFVWSNASGILSRSTSEVPRLVLPDDLFANVAVAIDSQINQFLQFIQDVACGRNLKQFVMVVASLWAAAVIGSWCNFLTVFYIASDSGVGAPVIGSRVPFTCGSSSTAVVPCQFPCYIAAHTLPFLYERYEDQVDDFIYKFFGQLQNQYRKLDKGVLSKIPKGNLYSKKAD